MGCMATPWAIDTQWFTASDNRRLAEKRLRNTADFGLFWNDIYAILSEGKHNNIISNNNLFILFAF